MSTCMASLPGSLLDVLRSGTLTEEQARKIYARGPEAVVFALLELTKPLSEQRADQCPKCGGRLQRCEETRTRYTEDIPHIQPEVTEHVIHRDWCPKCRKRGEPAVPEALPGAALGNHVLVLSAWLHYALGNT